MQLYQQTIRRAVYSQGIGLHTGKQVDLALIPAPAGTGIRFLRADLPDSSPIVARSSSIMDTRLATTISNGSAFVSTTEHLMAALLAYGIDNLLIEVSGPEVPVFDGSAKRFVEMIKDGGIRVLTAPRTYLVPTQTVEINDGDKWIRLEPTGDTLRVDCHIDFTHPAIGAQHFGCDVTGEIFAREVAPARTFGFVRELEVLQSAGLGLGGGLENAVVLDDERVINEDGLRYRDEFVRHKALDIIGDLALVGLPLMGHVTAHKSGHALNARLTQMLYDRPELWERFVPVAPEAACAV